MPVTKSAQKKQRQDKKRQTSNASVRSSYKKAIKKVAKPAAKGSTLGSLAKLAMSAIDKAVKKNVMHKNKAARLKSRVSKLSR
ncbi:MAG: 30S ribosomal protein S20 [Microgenomates bacterium OLB23]|nr:MAG: 30S ribosomal protein S20 [Microgenomates bacterium OLB23]